MRSYDVQLANLPSIPLAVIRRQVSRAALSAAVREGCGVVWNFIRAQNLKGGRNVAVYLDGAIHLEVGVELAVNFAEGDGIVRSGTPVGWTASVAHIGPYEQMGAAHAAIRDWATAHGHTLAGANWEIYGHWKSEWNTDPSQIRTDIFYQVVPSGSPTG